MKNIAYRIVASLAIAALVSCSMYIRSDSLQAQSGADNRLVLTLGKKDWVHNGRTLSAPQPYLVNDGVPYAPLTGIAPVFGFKTSYDSASKQAIASKGSEVYRFQPGSSVVIGNEGKIEGAAKAYAYKGSLMIPLETWASLTGSRIVAGGRTAVLEWDSSKPDGTEPAADAEFAVSADGLGKLKVSGNGRFLETEDGKPFFWLADTAWEAIQRLNRSEVGKYLKSSAEQGFNVVQVVALTHYWDRSVPNAHDDLPLTNADPGKPLTTEGNDPSDPKQYDYWDHADYFIDKAASHGLYVALLPTWGKYILDNRAAYQQPYQGLFDAEKAYLYGKWIGSRYADRSNVVWVLGGDRAPVNEDQEELIRQMAKGIRDGGGSQLMTFHPIGGKSSSQWFHDEDWLDFNMYQSGHLSRDYPNYKKISQDYARKPAKPVLDAEPRYEESGINFSSSNGRFSAYDARTAAYWPVFAGAFGHSYGHGSIWQMYAPGRTADEDVYWYDAIDAEGRAQMKYVRKLIESRPFLERVPDQTLLVEEGAGGSHLRATRGSDYAMVYSPRGSEIRVRMGKISGEEVSASWYDPRTGVTTRIADYANTGTRTFLPPTSGIGQDWILLLDDKAAGFEAP
ncbi:DUF4038 domain-containing protein [Cohnella sp.]|uniref:apiosidase-like domain-containing protein n=1 Tax=Cohnella sp. TaxID=1883426 RepID=UPI0035682D75